MKPPPHSIPLYQRPWALALGVVLLWLACLGPSLERTRLQDVDELTGARCAQGAALQGHWWPLTLDGRIFYEKPPLLLWLAAATAKAGGSPYAAWPYRVWTCLGGALALASLVLLGGVLGRPWAGAAAALALGLQGDFLFHARYFTFDTPFLGCALASLALSARALRRGEARDWVPAGLALAFAAAFKSWFVLALVPAYVSALALALPPGRRWKPALALALPPLAVLAAWVALYVSWMGPGFLVEEWGVNLAGRAMGRSNELDPEGHAAYYLKWAARSAPALLPWVLAVPLGLAPRGLASAKQAVPPESRTWIFARAWAWALCLSWLLGLALVRAETINYPLPLEAGLCLAFGLELGRGRSQPWALILLLALALASSQRLWDPGWSLAAGLPAGWLWWRLERSGKEPWPAGPLLSLAGAALVLALALEAYALLARPLDPSRAVADLLLAHPAGRPGQPLIVVGPPTQAPDFYGSYTVRRLGAPPEERPQEAALVRTHGGWVFYPAKQARP